ncbi:hypothetical protein PG994_004876 [Apiospora phragmitis]|uniref:Uncharacterized protein n=1 Tax=Apiospora phragmitis TaxID=2905665 RepID=A0ABR1VS30_9PEZI
MYFNNAIAIAILAYCAAAAPAGPTCASSEDVCRKYTANNGLSSVECNIAVAQCIGACKVSFDRCSTAPDANHATCAASLVGCTGKSLDESLKPQSAVAKKDAVADASCALKDDACRTAPGANMAECSAQKAECKDTCSTAADSCRGGPDANMAACAGDYAKCLGYNPYAKRDEAPHSETGDAVYFPAPHSETGDAVYFPAPKSKAAASGCVLKDDACRTAPDANMAQCSAEKAACKATCKADSNQCRTAPDANQAQCSADYASCLGENPYAKKRGTPQGYSGSAVHQGDCEKADTACRTAPGANMAQCSAEKASCKNMCSGEADACRAVPGANMSTCSAEYAQCLGTNPYAKRGDAPQSSSGSAVHRGNCEAADDACRTAPDANMSFCSAQKASCKDMCSGEADACRAAPQREHEHLLG